MTSSATLVTLFKTEVFDHASIQAVSPNLITYDIVRDSEPELKRLYHAQEISFWNLLIRRAEDSAVTGVRNFTFDVQILLFLEKDTSGDNWKRVRDGFETLTDRVGETIFDDSSGTVDYITPQSSPVQIAQLNEFETICWRGEYNYQATKR